MDKLLETATLYIIVRRKFLQRRLGRYDDSDGFGTVSCSMYTDVGNNCGRTIDRLQL